MMRSLSDLARAATQDGTLDKKTKELIAIALGVASHCDACIGFHVKALIALGATKGELEEALGMVVYMGGGPSLMFSANALAAFDELSAPAWACTSRWPVAIRAIAQHRTGATRSLTSGASIRRRR
jgi:AhpD family alkylhydroperoxidase